MTTTKVNLANTVEGILPVANGGTGTSTGVAPGGSTTQVQYNNAGAFGGSANLTFNGTTLTAAALTSTGVATFSAGTVSAPAITTSGDTNTGIFFPAADTIAFTEGGAESMRIDSSGNVGIGTSSPSTKLQVSGAASTNNTSRFVAKFTDTSAVALGNGGGIMFQGVYTGTTAIDCSGIQAYKENATDGNYAYAMTFATRANGGDLTERMRITSSGSLLIGTTAEADKFTVNGNMCLNTSIGYVFSNGGGSGGSVNAGIGLDGGGNTLRFYTGGAANERMRIASNGALGFSGANYGSSGQVLTSNGSGSAPSWGSVTMPAGSIIQVLQAINNTIYSIGAASNTTLTNMSITITPRNSSSRFLIKFTGSFGYSGGATFALNVFRDSTNLNQMSSGTYNGMQGGIINGGSAPTGGISFVDSPATASAITYTIRVSNDGTLFVGRRSADTFSAISQIMQVMEIAG
jgi:hypothetical protein